MYAYLQLSRVIITKPHKYIFGVKHAFVKDKEEQ